jgi:hypothetical protein
MKIKKEEEKLVLSGNELFGAIGIVAIFFFCVGIRLLIACIWPEDGITDWFGTALVAIWTCLALWMALRSINDALTCLVLDENGAELRRPFGKKRIAWSQVRDWGLSYVGLANHDDNAYEFYFAEEPQQEKNEYARKLTLRVLRYTVIGEEYQQVVQEVLPVCRRVARVAPFVPEDVPHMI